ncbi:hypothetical protein COHA_010203 [Chlorella ohadii]|uniref:U5 small nuclear ribonucleoprotein TSSC4 n=1 Tax=Chlorella ohadii TaxID=2649997 RepID=A0AAD5DD97_9CHLO|nr:hypothetical protein COHA_010203 [Chlorella ohadii]
MAGLQQRLDAAFGALGAGAEAPAWKPSQQQIFRSGAPVNDGNSSDEEYEERQRRETVPGLAQSLVEEDAPDAEGFRPSTAFCRALDAEEEYNEIDEVATGLIARRRGRDALPPRDTQVLEDNVYEQRAAAAEAAAVGEGHHPEGMEVEEPAGAAPPAELPTAAPVLRRSSLSGRTSSGGSEEASKEKKKVRFEGVAAPYVPPSRRPGFVPRSTELPPGPGDQPQRQSLSTVPDHVKHPERYQCYVLDEPLVVGGGVGQLAGEQENVRQAGGASDAAAEEPEPERWEGPVGVAGAVQFRPRRQRDESGAMVAEGSGAAAGSAAGKKAAQPAVAAAFDDEGVEEEGGEDAAMRDAVPQPKGKQRHYRTSRRVSDDAE